MGTRVIDMSDCPCCCPKPDYLELTIDYGGTCTGYFEPHQPGGLPIDCTKIPTDYYLSAGTVIVQVPWVPEVGGYVYTGTEGSLIEYIQYLCAGGPEERGKDSIWLHMNYTPPISPYIPYTNGGAINWPDGYCLVNGATATATIAQNTTHFQFNLWYYNGVIHDPSCISGCIIDSDPTPRVFCCSEDTEADLMDWQSSGTASVNVSSNGLCLTEAAWDASTPCMTWNSMGGMSGGNIPAECPNSVVCAGGVWLFANIMAMAKVHVRAIRL